MTVTTTSPSSSAPAQSRPTMTAHAVGRAVRRGMSRWWVVLLVVVAIVGGVIALWEEVLEDRYIVRNFGIVEAGEIYRSGQISRHLLDDVIERHNIQAVINLGYDHDRNPDIVNEVALADELGLDRTVYHLKGDGTGDPEMYILALKDLVAARRADKPVLVHCSAGSERTSGTIGLYRVLIQGRDPAWAVEEMKRHEHDAKDGELIPFLNEHMAFFARRLKEEGLINQIPDPLPKFPRG